MEENRIKEILDIANVGACDGVFLIGADEPQVIACCLRRGVERILVVDDVQPKLDDVERLYHGMEKIEIANAQELHSRWLHNYDVVISMKDLCDLKNPKQLVCNLSKVTCKGARFVIVCKSKQSDDEIAEVLNGHFMTTIRYHKDDMYIMYGIKLPERRR